MLEKIEQLSLDVSNIIIYTNSAILQNVLNKKIRERFKIEKNLTKYADSAATLKIAKNESFMPPFGGGIWLVDVKCDNIPIKEIAKAINNVSYGSVNVYWVKKYADYKKICDLDVVKKQGIFCFTMYTGRLGPDDIGYLHNAMLPEGKRLPEKLLSYLKKNYTYDVGSVCELFDAILQDHIIKSTKDIINLVGIGGNTVDSFVIKLLTTNPKTDKGLSKALEKNLILLEDLSYTIKYDSLRNFIYSAVDNIMEIKQLQVMGRYSTVVKNIPEVGFNEEKLKRYKRFEHIILEDINIARVLKLKMIMSKYRSFDPRVDLLQTISTYLSEIAQSNKDNPESKEFSGKRRRRKI